jgi:hypothetical protein
MRESFVMIAKEQPHKSRSLLQTMDDFAWAPALGITVIAQPAYQMGQKAAEFVVENPARPARLTFEPRLIARTSCGEKAPAGTERSELTPEFGYT